MTLSMNRMRHFLDVIRGEAMSNYANHVAHAPLDTAWEAPVWRAPQPEVCDHLASNRG